MEALFSAGDGPLATREASGRVVNAIVERVRSFTGGSADLAPSTKTLFKDHGHYGFEKYCGHSQSRCSESKRPLTPKFRGKKRLTTGLDILNHTC